MHNSRQNIKVAVAFNQPTQSTNDDGDFISEEAVIDEAKAVYAALTELNHDVQYFPINNIVENMIQLKQFEPGVIFNLCEGYRGKAYYESHITGLWEIMGIPYTGNKPLTLGISLDKALTKKLFESKKIPTPIFQVFKKTPEKTYLKFPLIVKPCGEDASLGITQDSIVQNFEQMRKIVELLLEKYKQPVLVEQYIEGREFNISILGNNPPKVLAISEIDFSLVGERYYPITSYEAKWLKDHPLYNNTPAICPAKISSELTDKLSDTALRVYSLLGGRDYGRVDMRVTASDSIYVLEFNPNPDISPDAGFARAINNVNMSYTQFVDFLLQEAMDRKEND